jgi:hypothetical protein
MIDRKWTNKELVEFLIYKPDYEILLGADSVIAPSPWTREFRVEVDDELKVIRMCGDFT